MGKQKKRWLKIFGLIIIVLGIGFAIAHYVVKSKIENALTSKLPETVKLTYGDLGVSLLQGKITLSKVEMTNFGKTIPEPNLEMTLEQLIIDGFGYWSFLVNKAIFIEAVILNSPKVTYHHNPNISKDAYKVSNKQSFNTSIEVKQLLLNQGFIKVLNSETDSLKLQMEEVDISLNEIVYNNNTKKNRIPFDHGTYQVLFQKFFGQMSDYENLRISEAVLTQESIALRDLTLRTKYSKETLSKIIPYERDHFNLQVDSLVVKQPNLGVVKDTIWKFESPKVAFHNPVFKVYRDKLVTDDERIKPLYSKMLRELKFQLDLERVLIHEADISYSEKVKADKKAGTVTFKAFNADIQKVSNTYKSPTKTVLNIETRFMNHAPLKAVWSFDVNNQEDLFEFQAEIDLLQARYLNSFTEPNLNVRLEGELDKTYFTISGTDDASSIDFKVKYQDFDVVALQDNGQEKNKFLSDVINIFVSKNSRSKQSSFKEATKDNIERHKTQSVFNFIWISARAGLLKTMTID